MNRIIRFGCTMLLINQLNAQNPNANAQWRINGNSASTSDFIGTTNNQSLILKTNNIQRALFDAQGRTIFDGGGEVIIHPGGLNRPILSNPIAQYMLKVGGSGHFDGEVNARQLFIQEYITFLKSMKGPRIDVDTIRMDSTRGIFGKTKIFGDVQINQNLEVLGKTTLKGDFVAEKGFTFDGTSGFKLIPATANAPQTFLYGGVLQPYNTYCAAGPQAWANHQFGGMLQIYDYNNPTTSGLLNLQTWTGGSSIDASTGGQNTGGLLLNYFCHSPTFINTGWSSNVDGGRVYMGAEVDMQRSLKIGWTQSGAIDPNTSIEINQSVSGGNAIKFRTYNNGLKLITVENVNFTNSPFTVYGDGKTHIGIGRPKVGGVAENAMLTVDGLILAKEVRVAISTTTHWADYVFDKNYKLMTLSDVETYIKKNHHLPDVPSAENVKENGIDMLEISATLLKKIEELTLYTIELQKQLDEQKKIIDLIKK